MKALRLGIWSRLATQALRVHRTPPRAFAAIRSVAQARSTAAGGLAPRKFIVVGGRTFFSLHAPGCPSAAFDRYVRLELSRASAVRTAPDLQSAVVAITRRCGLRCAHCSEWETLGRPDTLAVDDLLEIVQRLRSAGAVQLKISGGEPLLRLDAIEEICRRMRDDCDLWIFTSGAPLTAEVAGRLRAAGATGVMVSLDHFDAAAHDAFRGVPGTFERATAGVRHASAAGLVVALSLTATRAFVSAENLERYARLARQLGAGFIEILEPRAVGRWAGADVALTRAQMALLEAFDRAMNQDRPDMPLVDYPARGQRRDGCWGSGNRYLFVDAEGGVHACPFCRGAVGKCLDEPLDRIRERLQLRGCHAYRSPNPCSNPSRSARKTTRIVRPPA